MSSSDDDFDAPDDFDEAEDDSIEALVWQLLQLINPGDEETALQQFDDYRETVAPLAEDTFAPVDIVGHVIDWRSGFRVDAGDTRALVQAVDELCARWNLSIDWNGEPAEDEFFEDIDGASLFATAYDRLAEFGYILWAWETDADSYAGWITLSRDAEPMREIANALGINLRLGSEVT